MSTQPAPQSQPPNKTPEHHHLELLLANKLPQSPIYAFLLTPLHITSATRNHFTARLPLSPAHLNSAGSLHGSVSATIVDWAGGMAIATHDLRSSTGVSVDIHVSYQAGAKLGETVEIEGVVERVGGNLAFTRVGIYGVEEGRRGRLVASGTHTKFVRGTGR